MDFNVLYEIVGRRIFALRIPFQTFFESFKYKIDSELDETTF